MKRPRLLIALASVFAGIAVLLVMLGITFNLLIVLFAIPFGLAAYLLWYHVTGRLLEQARRRTVDPRERAARERAARDARARDPRSRFNGGRPFDEGRTRGAGAAVPPSPGISVREAYRRLDLEPGADEEAVRRAYRRKVKDVHPDREGGSEEAFREVRQAYDRLSEGQ